MQTEGRRWALLLAAVGLVMWVPAESRGQGRPALAACAAPGTAAGEPAYTYRCSGLSCACVAGQSSFPNVRIWDIASVTNPQGAAAQTEILIIVTPRPVSPGTQSTCRIDATVAFHDLAGQLVGLAEGTLLASAPVWVVPQPPFNAGALRKRFRVGAHGTAAGCTTDEILSLRAELRTSDDLSGVVWERSLTVRLTFAGDGRPPIVPTHVVPPAARGVAAVLTTPCAVGYHYQCTGLACACVAGQSVTPKEELLFDFADGSVLQAGETVEVIVSAAPVSPDSACRTDAIAEIAEAGGAPLVVQAVQLSAASPSAVVEWSESSSALLRRELTVRVRGVARGCTMAEFARLGVSLATYETATGRTVNYIPTPGRPLLIVAEEVEGEALGSVPLPILPAYTFPPGR
jgi:hypothetical protein